MTSDDRDLEYIHKVLRMMLTHVRDPIHRDSLALFTFSVVVLRAIPFSRCIKHFDFDLTCDVTDYTKVIKACFPLTVLQGF